MTNQLINIGARLVQQLAAAIETFALSPYSWPLVTFLLGLAIGGLIFNKLAYAAGKADEKRGLGYLVSLKHGDRI